MPGLHRRGSSAALYIPIHGEPGDITESFASATPRGRTGSLSADNMRPAKDELEELEEKEAFIPTTRYDRSGSMGALGWRDASGRRRRRTCGWKAKLALMALLGGSIGAAVWFIFLRADSSSEDNWLDAHKPGWWRSSLSSPVAEAEATASSAASGVKAENVKWDMATSALGDAYGTATSKWSEATQAAYKAAYDADDEEYTDDELFNEEDDGKDAQLSSSSSKSAIAAGAFSLATSELVSSLLDNGTLASHKWHETLSSLGAGSSLLSSLGTGADGRILVVGDLHGTHRSLLSLLKRLSFSPSSDTLLHVGDVVGKSALNDSLATVSLLRKLGAKGVRGNHDQRVLEWRKWMEAYGPLDQSASPAIDASVKKIAAAVKGMQHVGAQAQSGFSRAGKAAAYAEDAAASKLKSGYRGAAKLVPGSGNGPAPRRHKVRRGWMSWLTGDGANEDAASAEAAQTEIDAEVAAEEEYGGFSYAALVGVHAVSSASRAASKAASAIAEATETASLLAGVRRPFGRPTTSNTRSSSSARATATGTASPSRLVASPLASSSYDRTGALVGALYAHLDKSLSSAQLKKLGIVVPDGWEWGGEHFEIARHLSSADAGYLESLPLTLYVDEMKSFVVHAGMVPWSSLDRTLARVSHLSTKQALPSTLDSSTPLAFTPSSSLARLLTAHSARTALLLEQLNTSPFTLLNMRTLSHAGGTAKNAKGVKGPTGGGEWSVSAKGRKAGKGAQPWWAVWEEGMRECAERSGDDSEDESACDEVGVVYGHWAGQGLQVQDHSIGLDSGCVYGRRLSALVIPLSSSSASPLSTSTGSSLLSIVNSTLHNFTSAVSHAKNATLPSAASKLVSAVASTAATETARAKANWHGKMQRVKASTASSSSSSGSPATHDALPSATAGALSSFADTDDFEDLDVAPLAEETEETSKPWWRPWKRAPPQGRPGVAPWHEHARDADGGADEAAVPHARVAKGKGRGKKLAVAAVEPKQEEAAEALHEDNVEEAAEVAELIEVDAEEGDDDETDESAFAEEKVVLAAAGGKVAWIVSVDCAAEADIE